MDLLKHPLALLPLRAQALVCADPARAMQLLNHALEIYDPEVDGFDHARTLLLKAQRDSRSDTRAAALYAFRRLGAAPWVRD